MSDAALATTVPNPSADRRAAILRKTRLKFFVRRWIGELYVGKRMKMRHLTRLMRNLPLPRTLRLLEVGCEDGAFCDWLSRLWPTATVEGLDRNAEQIEACARWAQQTGRAYKLRFRHGDVLELAIENTYDLIICFDVLGYIPDDKAAIRNMTRALKPGGWLVIHQPNTTYQRFDGTRHYVPPEKAHAITEGHVRHGYTPEEFITLFDPRHVIVERLIRLNGRLSDLAHRFYHWFETPAPLRLITLPIVDLISEFDRRLPVSHGNTTCVLVRKRSQV